MTPRGQRARGESEVVRKLARLVAPLALGLALAGRCPATVYVDRDAPAGGNGNSWATAYRTIQAGINDADALDEEVWVAEGTYMEAITLKSGVAVYGGFAGTETQRSQRNTSANVTSIDVSAANGGSPAPVAVAMKWVTNVAIDGFTIVGASNGGDYGGGIACLRAEGSCAISNCQIMGNAAPGGAGIYLFYSSVAITSCTISGNTALSQGGGIYASDSTVAIDNCTLSGNSASQGGGVYSNWCSPQIINCTLSGNSASDKGGAIYCHVAMASPKIVNCTICDNTANKGGAVFGGYGYVFPYPIVITNTILAGNAGHAIYEEGMNVWPRYCLFRNRFGDFFDAQTGPQTGAKNVNSRVGGASGNVDGLPQFVVGLSGTWTAAPTYDNGKNRTTLTNATASLTPGSLIGRLLNANILEQHQTVIIGNTATTIQVAGNSTAYVKSGDAYRVIDYHLQNGSAALDRATTAGAPAIDFDGQSRPGTDGLVDIGVDEAPSAYTPAAYVPPLSHVESLPFATGTAVVRIPYFAFSDQSGVKYVQLFYRRNGSLWTKYNGNFTTSPIAFNSATTGGDGIYEFYTLATDNDNRTEEIPQGADEQIMVVTACFGSRVYVDKKATGSSLGTSWANALQEIGPAPIVAVLAGAHEIWVAEGTYSESIVLTSGVAVYGGFRGTETLLSQRNPAAHPTVINVGAVNGGGPAKRAVMMANATNARIDGFTITGGYATADTGGGICCAQSDASCVIANCTVFNNYAQYGGGGICCIASSPTITGCLVFGNRNQDEVGGGIACVSAAPRIENCRIIGNASSYGGGGVGLVGASSPSFINCTIADNSASGPGGGIACRGGQFLTLTNCIISDNLASYHGSFGNGYGGAVAFTLGCAGRVSNCVISSNRATDAGGGVYCSSSSPTISNTIFEKNTKYAIWESGNSSDPTALSCLFNNNPNGDFYDYESGAQIGAANINSNVRGTRGNVDGDPMFQMGASGYWTELPAYDSSTSRTRLTGADAAFAPGALAGQLINPDVSQLRSCLIASNSATTIDVWGNVASFVAIGDSYQVLDYHLRRGSPCIDRGTSVGAPTTDIEGRPRPVDIAGVGANGTGTEYDIGAYEVQRIPGIAVTPAAANFGIQRVSDGPTASVPVVIANDGYGNLQFTGAGIALTGARASQFRIMNNPAKTPLAPGANRTVSVAFDPSSVGPATATLTITTNAPTSPTVRVALTGTATDQEITVVGGPLAFGSWDVDSGQCAVKTVQIRNDGTAVLNFTGAGIALTGAKANQFQITNSPPHTPLLPGYSRLVDVTFDPSSPGPKSANLAITTDDRSEPTVNVALSGTAVDQEITVLGGPLAFGGWDMDNGPAPAKTVTIRNDGSAPLNFTAWGISLGGTDREQFRITNNPATTPLPPGTARTVNIVFDPSSLGPKSASLSILTDDTDEPTVVVPLSGTGINPEITVSPMSLAFGVVDVHAGACSPKSVTIKNDGVTPLNFTGAGIVLTGSATDEFRITNSPAKTPLAPGASRTVSVVFDPYILGPRSAALTITTEDSDEATVNVTLSGQGSGVTAARKDWPLYE